MGTATIMAVLIANGNDNSLQAWARPIAAKEVEEEDAIFAAYADVSSCWRAGRAAWEGMTGRGALWVTGGGA